MNIIEIKDVITSKRNEKFPELIKTLIFSASKEVNGEVVTVDNFMVPLLPPIEENYLPYESITDDQLKEWALQSIQEKEQIINDVFERRLQRLKNEQQQLNQ